LSLIPRIVSKKLIILLGLAFVVIGLFLNELLLHKAKLTIFLPSQTIKKDVGLTERDVTLKTFTKTFEFSESQNTTGKKEVGEKARGTVTVHNFDDKEKAFSKGIILDSAGIKFILDQEVKVASASVVTINGGLVKQPGKTKTNATAQLIGPQANLSSGKQFKIEDFPTGLYFAINESSLTGGTKKDLKTVAKKDADDLKNKIIEKAKRQKVDLQKENMANVKIIDELTKASFTDTKFNKEIGEEASLLTLEAKVKETIYFYQTDELDSYLAKILSDSLQKGFTLQKDKLTYEISKIEQQDNKTNIQIKAQGKSLQEIAKKDVVKLVKGRNKNSLENLLKNSFNAEGFELEIEPELPVFGNMMPFFEKNITLKISSL
ncbi:hypothetical protein HY357_01250, partial [Candidatus Roizmanbacteria bacterium]|nr:hypothetical protein [Candidatus Roizmanbacteria bacterium]